jgi:hypothetical protein
MGFGGGLLHCTNTILGRLPMMSRLLPAFLLQRNIGCRGAAKSRA